MDNNYELCNGTYVTAPAQWEICRRRETCRRWLETQTKGKSSNKFLCKDNRINFNMYIPVTTKL